MHHQGGYLGYLVPSGIGRELGAHEKCNPWGMLIRKREFTELQLASSTKKQEKNRYCLTLVAALYVCCRESCGGLEALKFKLSRLPASAYIHVKARCPLIL